MNHDGGKVEGADQKLGQGLMQTSKLLFRFYLAYLEVAVVKLAWLLWLEALLVSVL